jgi:hypothetical protein
MNKDMHPETPANPAIGSKRKLAKNAGLVGLVIMAASMLGGCYVGPAYGPGGGYYGHEHYHHDYRY